MRILSQSGESGPMNFTNYSEVVSMGSMIEFVTQSGYMPPWPPDQDYSSLLDEHFLTDGEKQIISDWVSNGMPQGDPKRQKCHILAKARPLESRIMFLN